MSRLKLFIENFFVYGLANIVGKIVPLVMLPIVTRLVPDTSIYGISDLLHVVASFASTFALLGMYDAMFRLYFDKEDPLYRNTVCSSAFGIVLRSGIIAAIALIVLSKPLSIAFFGTDDYYQWLILIGIQVFISAVGSIVKAPTRIQNKRKVFVTVSILNPIMSYAVSIPLIIFIDPLFGLIFGAFATSVADLIIFWVLNKNWFRGRMNKKLAVDLLKFGLPLVPNLLVFWVFNSFDRIMISSILGPSYNGIYAVGARVAQISQFIYIAFAGGWQYFAFSTMRDKDYKEMMSKVWRILAAISFISWALIYPFNELIFNLLFEGDYVNGSQVFPYLFLSPLLHMLYSVISTQFLVSKKTYWSTVILFLGASANVFLNFALIPPLGIRGAAISTMVGYSISVVLAGIVVAAKRQMFFKKKTLLNVLAFAFLILLNIWNVSNFLINCLTSAIFVIITLLISWTDISELISRLLRKDPNLEVNK